MSDPRLPETRSAAVTAGGDGRPPHPGHVLLHQFLKPHGQNRHDLERRTALAPELLMRLIEGEAPVTPHVANELARFFGNTSHFWRRLQAAHEGRELDPGTRPRFVEPLPWEARRLEPGVHHVLMLVEPDHLVGDESASYLQALEKAVTTALEARVPVLYRAGLLLYRRIGALLSQPGVHELKPRQRWQKGRRRSRLQRLLADVDLIANLAGRPPHRTRLAVAGAWIRTCVFGFAARRCRHVLTRWGEAYYEGWMEYPRRALDQADILEDVVLLDRNGIPLGCDSGLLRGCQSPARLPF